MKKIVVVEIYGFSYVFSANSINTNIEDIVEDGFCPENLIVTKDGEPFECNTVTFVGHRLDNEDALAQTFAAFIRDDSNYHFKEVCEEWSKIKESIPMVDSIPNCREYIYYGSFLEKFTLHFVTEGCRYYSNEEKLICFDDDNKLLSDNSFAEDAFWSDIGAIERGEIHKLYFNGSDEDWETIVKQAS